MEVELSDQERFFVAATLRCCLSSVSPGWRPGEVPGPPGWRTRSAVGGTARQRSSGGWLPGERLDSADAPNRTGQGGRRSQSVDGPPRAAPAGLVLERPDPTAAEKRRQS